LNHLSVALHKGRIDLVFWVAVIRDHLSGRS